MKTSIIQKFKVMIVEESPVTIKKYKDQIKDHFEVHYFTKPSSALIHYAGAKYDLVVLDLMLSEKGCESLIFDIKYFNPNQKIVIASSPGSQQISGYDNVQVIEKPLKIIEVVECALLGKAIATSYSDLRRKHPRFHVDLIAKLIIPNQKEKIPIHITNVSLGGIFIEGHFPKLENPIPIELPIFDQDHVFYMEKRWEKEGYGVGLKFQNIDVPEYALLAKYLESLNIKIA